MERKIAFTRFKAQSGDNSITKTTPGLRLITRVNARDPLHPGYGLRPAYGHALLLDISSVLSSPLTAKSL